MNLRNLSFTFIVAVLVGVAVYLYKPQEAEMKLPFPYLNEVNPKIGMNCKALVGSVMYGSNTGDDKGIHAELFKGTDEIAIEVDEDDNFNFITKAAIGIGQAKSDTDWRVALNNKDYLIAIMDNNLGSSIPIENAIDTFMLNKKNGMATWTKGRITNLGTNTPEAQSYLLKCR